MCLTLLRRIFYLVNLCTWKVLEEIIHHSLYDMTWETICYERKTIRFSVGCWIRLHLKNSANAKLVCVNETTAVGKSVGKLLARIETGFIFRQQFVGKLSGRIETGFIFGQQFVWKVWREQFANSLSTWLPIVLVSFTHTKFEFPNEFAKFSFPCEGRFRLPTPNGWICFYLD